MTVRVFDDPMGQSGESANAEVRTILLTVTLPLSKGAELCKRMYRTGERVSIFRARTTGKDMQYRIVMLVEGSSPRKWDDPVTEAKHEQYYLGKVIMYANTVNKVKDLADGLGVDAYHNTAGTKAERFEEFRSGRERVGLDKQNP